PFEEQYNTRNITRTADARVESTVSYIVSCRDLLYWVKEEQVSEVQRSPMSKKIILVYEQTYVIKNTIIKFLYNIFMCIRLSRIFKVLSEKGYCIISGNALVAATGKDTPEFILPLIRSADAFL